MNAPSFLNPTAAALYERIADRSARIGVIGLGYVGVPLAVEFARAGFSVVGIDTDARKCASINDGSSDVNDVPRTAITEQTAAGRLTATTDIALAGRLDALSVCVPTPLRKSKDPDLSHVISASHAIREHLRPGTLVVLESTTYPGATEELVLNILQTSGLRVGQDFFLAFSPERVDPANTEWNTRSIPKVVGGVTTDCAALASSLYERAVDHVVTVSSPRVAEMVKLLENTFRAVNIGLVNELAIICDHLGISVWEVIEAAATKPFGFMPFYPGPGLGGHCIPVDPYYLSWRVRQAGLEARFVDLAGQANAAMPHYVVDKIADALNHGGKSIKGSEVLLMGVAYKPEVNDVRESPALDVMNLLLKKGARVTYHDPFVPVIDGRYFPAGQPFDSAPYSRELVSRADCVVVLTNHEAFDYSEVATAAQAIVDTRGVIAPAPNVFPLGAPNPNR